MAGLAHISTGFAGKWLSSRIPLAVFLVASQLLDLLWVLFWLTGIESVGVPWSHGLLMSVFWSVLAGGIIFIFYRHLKSSLAVGAVVFSHWILDFITHPMGAVFGGEPLSPDLYLAFYNSPKVGLGLYNSSIVTVYVFDIGFGVLGILSYILYRKKVKKTGSVKA